MGHIKDLTGATFGHLTVLKLDHISSDKDGNHKTANWLCSCFCGKQKVVEGVYLRSRRLKFAVSCGCHKLKALQDKRYIYPQGYIGLKCLYANYKRRAKNKKIEFSIPFETFKALTSQNCVYCKSEPLQEIYQRKSSSDNIEYTKYSYNGLDRIDSSLGYTIDNVVPCCGICNTAKREFPVERLLQWIDRIKKS